VAPSGVCKYIVPNVSCWIDELRFVRSGPSNVHRCRAFPFALAGLFLCYIVFTFDLAVRYLKMKKTALIVLGWIIDTEWNVCTDACEISKGASCKNSACTVVRTTFYYKWFCVKVFAWMWWKNFYVTFDIFWLEWFKRLQLWKSLNIRLRIFHVDIFLASLILRSELCSTHSK